MIEANLRRGFLVSASAFLQHGRLSQSGRGVENNQSPSRFDRVDQARQPPRRDSVTERKLSRTRQMGLVQTPNDRSTPAALLSRRVRSCARERNFSGPFFNKIGSDEPRPFAETVGRADWSLVGALGLQRAGRGAAAVTSVGSLHSPHLRFLSVARDCQWGGPHPGAVLVSRAWMALAMRPKLDITRVVTWRENGCCSS